MKAVVFSLGLRYRRASLFRGVKGAEPSLLACGLESGPETLASTIYPRRQSKVPLCASVFASHISPIVSVGSGPQVFNGAAAGVIAPMEDERPFGRYVSAGQHPDKPMSLDLAPNSVAHDSEHAVAILVSISAPFQAARFKVSLQKRSALLLMQRNPQARRMAADKSLGLSLDVP